MATAAEIAGLDPDELASRVDETRRELFNLRFQLATGQLDDPTRLKYARKDIARLLTELRAREIAEAEGLALEELPAHRAAARQQAVDDAAGFVRTSPDDRRARRRAEREAARAEAEEAEGAEDEITEDEVDEVVDGDVEAGGADGAEVDEVVEAGGEPTEAADGVEDDER